MAGAHATGDPPAGRPRPAASRWTKLLGFLVASHGMLLFLKLLGIAGIVAFLGALQMRFSTGVAALALLHAAVIAAAVLVFRGWHRPRHGPRK